jgi:medium-chain acyl-[acyl-carrier-protein] hydrolase
VHLFVSGATAPQLPDREPPIRHLPDREFLTEVRQRYDALPQEIVRDDQMVEALLPALRADFAMAETYRHVGGPLLACPVSALGGQQDSSVSLYELAAWRTQTTGVFGFRLFPGGHFFVDSSRDAVLRYVTEDLERSLRGFVPGGREEEATRGSVAHAGPAPARGLAGTRDG